MSRLPYTQTWMMMVDRDVGGQTVSGLEPVGSSHIVLNQGDNGEAVGIREQVGAILAVAAARGIIAQPVQNDLAAIPALMTLPFDEARDLTCAQALARELRFTPGLAVRFDYAQNPPAIRFLSPAAENAGWLADFARDGAALDVRETQTGLPPAGCLLEIAVSGNVEGTAYSFSSFQAAGDTSDPERTLRAVLPVSGSESSADRRKLDLATADIPTDLNDAAFWRRWHADLKLIPADGIAIRQASRTGGGNLSLYPRFVTTAGVGMKELEEAGIAHFRTERLLCTAVVVTNVFPGQDPFDDSDSFEHIETASLSLEIIATDAETRLYRWTAESDATSGETVPPGLATALLAAHQADGSSAKVLCALKNGAALPLPGDTRNGLTAHTVTVDCRTFTVLVDFGPPAALGPVDLAGFLSGFRNLRRSSMHSSRDNGEVPARSETDGTLTLPATSSGWAKLGDNKIEVGGQAGGKAIIDPADLEKGKDAKFRDVSYTDALGKTKTMRVLAAEPSAGYPANDPDPCADHPEGGDGVASGDGDGVGSGGAGGDGGDDQQPGAGAGVPAEPADGEGGAGNGSGGGVSGCVSQCSI